MASQGDRDKVLGGHSFHSLRPDAFNYVWDNSIEQVLEVSSGEVVEFSLRDASDEQIQANSTSEDVAKLDFSPRQPGQRALLRPRRAAWRRARRRDPRI